MEQSLAYSQGWGESSTETLWFSSTFYSCSMAEQSFAKPQLFEPAVLQRLSFPKANQSIGSTVYLKSPRVYL